MGRRQLESALNGPKGMNVDLTIVDMNCRHLLCRLSGRIMKQGIRYVFLIALAPNHVRPFPLLGGYLNLPGGSIYFVGGMTVVWARVIYLPEPSFWMKPA